MQTIELFNLQAEQSVLGALLLDNDAFDRMGDLRAEHFYRADHRIIFSEILAQVGAGRPCDVVSVMDSLAGKVDDCLPYLNAIVQNTPSSANIGRYASIVRDKAVKRALVTFSDELGAQASTSHEDASSIVDSASSKLEKLAAARIKQEPVQVRDDLVRFMEQLEQRIDGNGPKPICTGFPDVDKRLSGGMRRGELVVIAARPKMGKTAFALNVANNVSVDHSVLVLSMEMPKDQIHERNLASIGRIQLDRLLQPKTLEDPDWVRMTHALTKLNDMNISVDDQGGLRLLDVRMKAKQVKRRHGLDLLVIDYLQLMYGDGDNRNAQIEGITRGLKALAKELGIVIVLLSQLNRELEKRPNKRPQPSDLRDSGAIEQDADAVLFLYRDEVYNPDSMDRGICEVNVALCRQGAPGVVGLAYIGEHTRFESLATWEPPRAKAVAPRRGLAEHL
ncbi:replicative DNA helicase [Herbaspirillum aquaticum]|uniref:replicative DNA helicase n=1 Tax=Herbaspirillum aquaticum TaxID=568783 RepID=UPI0024DE6B87|nr:replicative DNA helicase [Herbaspirillum aquaticum]